MNKDNVTQESGQVPAPNSKATKKEAKKEARRAAKEWQKQVKDKKASFTLSLIHISEPTRLL